MAQHYEVKEGEALVINGPANIIVKTGNLPVVGDGSNLQPPPVEDVAPVVTSVTPATAVSTDAPFALEIAGSGFTATSVVAINGSDLPTTFASDVSISAQVTPPTVAGGYPVTVKNGALVSNGDVMLTIADPAARGFKKR